MELKMISLLRLDRYVLGSLSIATRASTFNAIMAGRYEQKEEDEVKLSFLHSVRHHLKHRRYWVTLEVKAMWPEGKDSRFDTIAAKIEGFFSLPDDTPEETVKKYVPSLCISNMISLARGIISQATAFCPGGSFVLPLIDANVVARNSQSASPGSFVLPIETKKKKPLSKGKRKSSNSP
jgi:hypothetical protein